MSPKAKVYFECVVGVGALLFVDAVSRFESQNLNQFLAYLVAAIIGAMFKLRVPGMHASLSPVFAIVLVGIANCSLGEVMVIGCAATLVQCLWRTRSKPRGREVIFSVAAVAISILVAYNPAHTLLESREIGWGTWMVCLAALLFVLVNSGLVCGIIALVAECPFAEVWSLLTRRSLGCYLVGGVIATLAVVFDRLWGWKNGLWIIPLLYLTFTVGRKVWEAQEFAAIPIGASRSRSTSRLY